MEQTESDPEFQIGFAMCGAISAGAYSAGVLDFFIQALDAWEEARADAQYAGAIPTHRAGIKVFSGASAGAITGALGVIACAGGLRPQKVATAQPGKQDVQYVLPSLYDAWVERPCMVAKAGAAGLLQTDDLKDGSVNSVLCSKILDEIKDASLNIRRGAGAPLPYLSSTLHVYMMVTNLRGIPYSVAFEGGDYHMLSHGDRLHYCITGAGTWNTSSKFGDADKSRRIDAGNLFNATAPSQEWQDYALAALASGAFPLGLSPRLIHAKVSEYADRYWPLSGIGFDCKPTWPQPWDGDNERDFQFLSVDGGVINNEPFEYARFTLLKSLAGRNLREGDKADRAVIMIDPFPQGPNFLPDGKPANELFSIIMALVAAMKNQARFKPSELALAANEKVFSRFMIAPHRTTPDGKEELYALASGLLGGFGGFLSREFRDHDFQLGRRNCQKFLRDSFALPAANRLVASWPQPARDDPQFQTTAGPGSEPHFTIIPLVGGATAEVPFPEWPRISQSELNDLQKGIETRIEKIVETLILTKGPSWWIRRGLNFLYSRARRKVFDFIRLTILEDLVRRDQIKGWDIPNPWKLPPSVALEPQEVRMVWAALIDPSFNLRSEAGIAASTRLEIGKVRAILAASQAESGAPFEVWRASIEDRSGAPLYTLASRKPPWYARAPGAREISEWITPSSVDPPGL